jgi:hypothetical protein
MRRPILATLFALGTGLLGTLTGAAAQSLNQYDVPPVEAPPTPQAARPYGATYIPGVGFRYVTGGGPVVYGYYRDARAYRATRSARRCRDDGWFGRCRHWR